MYNKQKNTCIYLLPVTVRDVRKTMRIFPPESARVGHSKPFMVLQFTCCIVVKEPNWMQWNHHKRICERRSKCKTIQCNLFYLFVFRSLHGASNTWYKNFILTFCVNIYNCWKIRFFFLLLCNEAKIKQKTKKQKPVNDRILINRTALICNMHSTQSYNNWLANG